MRTAPALLALTALLLCSARAFAQDAPALAAMSGRVTVNGQPARAGAPLAAGEEIAVERGEAVLLFGNAAKFRLHPGARLRVEEHSSGATALTLRGGRLDAWVRGLEGRRLRLRAGPAVAHARASVFSAGADAGASFFRLYEGELGVADDFGAGLILTRGQRVEVGQSGLGGMGSLTPGESAPPVEPQARLPAAGRGSPALPPREQAPESLPALAAFASSPVQERALGGCAATVSPSAPCP